MRCEVVVSREGVFKNGSNPNTGQGARSWLFLAAG